jgi:hypothetical protein
MNSGPQAAKQPSEFERQLVSALAVRLYSATVALLVGIPVVEQMQMASRLRHA